MNVLMLGDIFGRPGRNIVAEYLPDLLEQYQPVITVANGENAAGGFGLTRKIADELFSLGIDVITSGNHIWDQKEMYSYIDNEPRILRPANYPPSAPGSACYIHESEMCTIAVINLIGRVFMADYDCPFRIIDQMIKELPDTVSHILVDFHGEATSEKIALARYLDGRVTAVVGTHTHVPTADEQILPEGTAYITDLGMCGPIHSILGVEPEIVISKFLTQLPTRFKVAKGPAELMGVVITLSEDGSAKKIKRLKIK